MCVWFWVKLDCFDICLFFDLFELECFIKVKLVLFLIWERKINKMCFVEYRVNLYLGLGKIFILIRNGF